MNSLIEQQYPILEMTLALRHQLLEQLTDEDLRFALPKNMTLGALCRQMGEFDRSYIEAFKNFKQEWTYRHPDTAVETSVAALREWYCTLEAEFKEAISRLTEEQVQTQIIERGTGWDFPVGIVFFTYREALLIFYAKAGVYLRELDKSFSAQWQQWIG